MIGGKGSISTDVETKFCKSIKKRRNNGHVKEHAVDTKYPRCY